MCPLEGLYRTIRSQKLQKLSVRRTLLDKQKQEILKCVRYKLSIGSPGSQILSVREKNEFSTYRYLFGHLYGWS